MKVPQRLMMIAAVIAIAAVVTGASGTHDTRPPAVAAERWVPAGERAGFAVSADTSSPTVAAVLYLKTDQGWRRARLVTDAAAIPLGHE